MADINEIAKPLEDQALDAVNGGKFYPGTPAEELWKKIGVDPKNKKKKKIGLNGEAVYEEDEALETAKSMFGMN